MTFKYRVRPRCSRKRGDRAKCRRDPRVIHVESHPSVLQTGFQHILVRKQLCASWDGRPRADDGYGSGDSRSTDEETSSHKPANVIFNQINPSSKNLNRVAVPIIGEESVLIKVKRHKGQGWILQGEFPWFEYSFVGGQSFHYLQWQSNDKRSLQCQDFYVLSIVSRGYLLSSVWWIVIK